MGEWTMLNFNPRLWWEEITGPAQFVRAIVSNLQEAQSVFLSVPDDLPWRDQMRRSVENILHETHLGLMMDYIDCQDDCPTDSAGNIDIANYLLARYALPDVQNSYRHSTGQTIQQYTLQNQVLKNRVIWVKGMTPVQVKNWLDYCRDYHAKTPDDGLFVIECHEAAGQRKIASGMKTLSYKDYASYHDALLFNNLLAAPMRRSLEWKQYLAAVAAKLCDCDVELSASLLEVYSGECNDDPIDVLRDISQSPNYAKRFHADFLNERHPFVFIRNDRREEMEQSVWNAQLQILFPLLEYERIQFIQCFYDGIKKGLGEEYQDPVHPDRHHYITQLGDRVEEPYDAEIGTLYRMNHLRMCRDTSLYLLYLPEERDREHLALLRDMRNTIAHVNICSPEVVAEFLNQYPYPWQVR